MDGGRHSPGRGIGFAVVAFALFATHDAIIKGLGAGYSVFQIIFFAMLFSFVAAAILVLADSSTGNFRPRHPWLILARSLLSVTGMSAAFFAFVSLPLAEVYALLFATPLLITALSVPLLGETVRAQRWAAVVVGLIGVIIVLRPGATALSPGHVSALVAALASALSAIIIRKIGGEERSAVMILYPMLASLAVMGAVLPFVYVPVELPALGLMAGVGLLSVAAQLGTIAAYRFAPAAVIAPMQYSQILWATLYGIVFFSERPDAMVAAGAAVIIASGLFIVWRESRANVSQRTPVLRSANPRYDAGPSPKPRLLRRRDRG
ncbi:DMT family transporter [Oricola cellulosilytica]|uniref:DMT family transporter n=1 Tax=Oricola cellulosilytica TaxID=1429082 RepID=A0A4R0PCT7_9HYPH|nr:DMT family transporter [Oricola cellulosilytica]TCD14119.1 DMT family transporter [Oricola cellulosilytica]